jgi:hypothetical protein
MNHSLDRQTHRRIVGSAFVMIATITLLGVAASAKGETPPAEPSIAVAMADGGYFIIR